jgi:bifunctional NMN adenylyltransferase/nudix hydrolase
MKFEYAVFIGRFQPFHKGHLTACLQALQSADKLIILVGSATSSPNIRNPFSFEERKEMILANLLPYANKVIILPIRDYYYSDPAWLAQVQKNVATASNNSNSIALIGFKKDETSYYLDLFPQWENVEVDYVNNINATRIRENYFSSTDFQIDLPQQTITFLEKFKNTSKYNNLVAEFEAIQSYKKQWSLSPYPPTFVTTDAVVVCCGHVLLITRKAFPGKGLLALPGGFIKEQEMLEDSCLRELKEETRIKVPLPVLKGSIVKSQVFDHPLRSVRGRTITQAYYIDLKDTSLPNVKGGDDAQKASWKSLSWVMQNPHLLFEDHYNIIEAFIGRGIQ